MPHRLEALGTDPVRELREREPLEEFERGERLLPQRHGVDGQGPIGDWTNPEFHKAPHHGSIASKRDDGGRLRLADSPEQALIQLARLIAGDVVPQSRPEDRCSLQLWPLVLSRELIPAAIDARQTIPGVDLIRQHCADSTLLHRLHRRPSQEPGKGERSLGAGVRVLIREDPDSTRYQSYEDTCIDSSNNGGFRRCAFPTHYV